MTNVLKITPSSREMLERISKDNGYLTLATITSAGTREVATLNKLRAAGYVVTCGHPTMKHPFLAIAAPAVAITDAGRDALRKSRPTLRETLQDSRTPHRRFSAR